MQFPRSLQKLSLAALIFFAAVPASAQTRRDATEPARSTLVNDVLIPSGISDQRVVQSLLATRRHEFVPAAQRRKAYYDMALPIGAQQTISSPFIVGFMTQSLNPLPTDRILEIGTGSGYQAAILSPLVKDVYTIEIVESLGERAKTVLRQQKYRNVHVRIGDGYKGWPEHAPFDKIIVTCSPEKVPQPLIDQLVDGGKIIVPVGERYQQTLYMMTKVDGELKREALRPTLFVPMTGAAEDARQVLPDLAKVQMKNLSFEGELDESGHLPGWYYQRQAERVDGQAKDGVTYVRFYNDISGRGSSMLQGFAIDGERYREIEITAWVRNEGVRHGPGDDMAPMIAMTFYDEQRSSRGQQWLGPWKGTSDWQRVTKKIRVPASAREGIFRIGLFGATGEFCVDGISLTPIPR